MILQHGTGVEWGKVKLPEVAIRKKTRWKLRVWQGNEGNEDLSTLVSRTQDALLNEQRQFFIKVKTIIHRELLHLVLSTNLGKV